MRPATSQANPVRLDRPRHGLSAIALPRLRRGDTSAIIAAPPTPPTAADLAAAIVAAPEFQFPAAPEHVVQADELLNIARRSWAAHEDTSGYDPAYIAQREAALRGRMGVAWSDLQAAARRLLSVTEAHEAGR